MVYFLGYVQTNETPLDEVQFAKDGAKRCGDGLEEAAVLLQLGGAGLQHLVVTRGRLTILLTSCVVISSEADIKLLFGI